MCLAQVLGMTGFMTYPALLPQLQAAWTLSNAAAGWITAVYFIGYLGAVTVLTSLTDRVDARRIYLWSMAVSIVSTVGFSVFADSIWSASLWRMLQGIGLAGTYMPGLRALTDRVPQTARSRAVAFYTANFVVGTSLSVFIAGEAFPLVGWRWTFLISAIGPVVAFALALRALKPLERPGGGVAAGPTRRLLDFRPVLRNGRAMGYTMAYACHCWELFGMRGWMVAFIAFGLSQAPARPFFKEFVVRLPRPADEVNAFLLEECGILGGYALGRDYPDRDGDMLIAVTEMNPKPAIDRLVDGLRRATA